MRAALISIILLSSEHPLLATYQSDEEEGSVGARKGTSSTGNPLDQKLSQRIFQKPNVGLKRSLNDPSNDLAYRLFSPVFLDRFWRLYRDCNEPEFSRFLLNYGRPLSYEPQPKDWEEGCWEEAVKFFQDLFTPLVLTKETYTPSKDLYPLSPGDIEWRAKESSILDLHNKGIDSLGVLVLARGLQMSPLAQFHIISVQGNSISPVGGIAIGVALSKQTALTDLNLGDISLSPEGVRAVLRSLSNSTALRTLDLSGNNLAEEGAQALAKFLPHLPALTDLNLRDISLSPEGARAIANALPAALRTLDLSGNRLGNVGARAIAQALSRLTSLTILGVEKSRIGKNGAQALAAALSQQTALTVLNFNYNYTYEVPYGYRRAPEEIVKVIEDSLFRNKELKSKTRAAPPAESPLVFMVRLLNQFLEASSETIEGLLKNGAMDLE